MLFYESARCLHGRAKPFEGRTFTNMFAHFSPKGEPNWFHQDESKRRKPAMTGAAAFAADKTSVDMLNEADESVQAWWVPGPGYNGAPDPILVAKIEGLSSLRFQGNIGDRYHIKGACEMNVTVRKDGEKIYLCRDDTDDEEEEDLHLEL